MTANEQIRMIKRDFEAIALAKGKEKEPLVAKLEGTISGRALALLLDPSIVLHIGRKSLHKPIHLLPTHGFESIFQLVDYLSERDGVTDQEIANIQGFIASLSPELQDFTKEYLQKTLKLGVTAKTLNKCFKEEGVSQMACMLANKFFEHQDAVDGKQFVITEKLDGVRCLAVVRAFERPVLLTRQGKRITGLVDIENELAAIGKKYNYEFVMDGELLPMDRRNIPSKEQYKRAMKIVSAKTDKKSGILFNAFDLISTDAFDERMCNTPYYLRRQKLEAVLTGSVHVKPVPVLYMGSDVSKIWQCLDNERAAEHEGVMINLLDAPYAFKRTNNLLKVKVMQDADLRVIGVQEGAGKFSGTLGSLIVDYKGNPVGVGSGLTDTVRHEVWLNQEKYIGRIAKVRFFEETRDKSGNISIRFPVFEEFREEGKQVSYS